MRLPLALALALTAAALPGAARAQTTENSTIAESLFRDAQARLAAGDIGAACDLFARSQRVEAALGTLLNLAACHERDGKTATAWTEFQNAINWAVRAGDHAREQYGRAQVEALEKQLHKVVIEVMEAAEGTQVLLDGANLPAEALGTAIPLDPGEHTIQVTASGKAPWVRKINLGPAAGTDRIEVKFEPIAPPAPPIAAPPGGGPADVLHAASADVAGQPAMAPLASASAEAPAGGAKGKRVAGVVAGGVGVVGVAVAIGLGVTMANNASNRDNWCPPGAPCNDQRAFDADHAARLDQQGMFIAGGIGIAALAAGTVLILTSPPRAQAAGRDVHVAFVPGPGGGAMGIQGRW